MSLQDELSGPNAGYIAEQYERYQTDPSTVDAELQAFFANGYQWDGSALASPPAEIPATAAAGVATSEFFISQIVAAARLGRIVRELGHLDARIDPLGSTPPSDPALTLERHKLTTEMLSALSPAVIGGALAKGTANALSALSNLRRAYSGSIGYEDDHVQIAEEREWLRESAETGRFFEGMGAEEKKDLLRQLTEVDTFEQFLDRTPPYAKQKRFSIEGADLMVPMIDAIIHCAAKTGTREVVMGMAHRGRLNVLAHILGKPYADILSEFAHPTPTTATKEDGETPENASVSDVSALGYTGDVKYHKGYRRAFVEGESNVMPITLAPNPSHLEFVSPAVVGRARAAQEDRTSAGTPLSDSKASLAILIHGDAAFPGQGVVPETLNMSRIPGYRIGGSIHIIVNNQLGFTTTPSEGRSTLYASDLAKGFEIPIVHVNADEPEACIAVAKMACAYRETFGKDFLIDLVGYRRYGHNEGEEPSFTQPLMYEKIRNHPRVREIFANRLIQQGIITQADAEAMVAEVQAKLTEARAAELAHKITNHHIADEPGDWNWVNAGQTGVPAETLNAINIALNTVPSDFQINEKIVKGVLKPRLEALESGKPAINWAHAEELALATILTDGVPVRLTGQDTERGTFTQRHLVWHDVTSGKRFCPMYELPGAKAAFGLHNSPLSETAALGFEYGYSVHATETLVLWEAQFGDFANGAQVILDQFIVSGNAKWGQSPSVVLLLPHGYEGQGPEHSSARLERFLQLCANDNLHVVNCSTPAQYFHLLRRQASLLSGEPRPLIVMTPKSLLRHPKVTSSLDELTTGRFRPLLDDVRDPARKATVTRLILCSGKIYTDLTVLAPEQRFAPRPEYAESDHIAVARIEEIYPFPAEELQELLLSYPSLQEVFWVQEEPKNMGAWSFVAPLLQELLQERLQEQFAGKVTLRYVGRPASASPSEGSISAHNLAQSRLITEAFHSVRSGESAASNSESRNGSSHGIHGDGTNGVSKRDAVSKKIKTTKTRTEETHAG